MTNDEKILEILEKHGALLERMDKRLDKLEDTQAKQGELLHKVDEQSQRTALLMEVEFQRKLDLLYEGHQTIMETITPWERIEEIEGRRLRPQNGRPQPGGGAEESTVNAALYIRVSTPEQAIHSLSEELQELIKAQ